MDPTVLPAENAPPGEEIQTTVAMDFSLDKALVDDLFNSDLTNDLWTYLARANYGFIIPGTSTYMTIGYNGGMVSGVGYKIYQDNGNKCGGYCAYQAADYGSYYWLWDVNDLLAVQRGEMESYEVRPYSYGEFDVPFVNPNKGYALIMGADYATESDTLYILLTETDTTQGVYEYAPLMLAYKLR